MPVDFQIELFQDLVGDRFRLLVPGGSELELRLSEVQALSPSTSPRGGHRTPFELLFHGPRTPWARQATHRLHHERLGNLEIFLVPLGPDDSGMRYEAIFT